jgi:hypothetical protein
VDFIAGLGIFLEAPAGDWTQSPPSPSVITTPHWLSYPGSFHTHITAVQLGRHCVLALAALHVTQESVVSHN